MPGDGKATEKEQEGWAVCVRAAQGHGQQAACWAGSVACPKSA